MDPTTPLLTAFSSIGVVSVLAYTLRNLYEKRQAETVALYDKLLVKMEAAHKETVDELKVRIEAQSGHIAAIVKSNDDLTEAQRIAAQSAATQAAAAAAVAQAAADARRGPQGA